MFFRFMSAAIDNAEYRDQGKTHVRDDESLMSLSYLYKRRDFLEFDEAINCSLRTVACLDETCVIFEDASPSIFGKYAGEGYVGNVNRENNSS